LFWYQCSVCLFTRFLPEPWMDVDWIFYGAGHVAIEFFLKCWALLILMPLCIRKWCAFTFSHAECPVFCIVCVLIGRETDRTRMVTAKVRPEAVGGREAVGVAVAKDLVEAVVVGRPLPPLQALLRSQSSPSAVLLLLRLVQQQRLQLQLAQAEQHRCLQEEVAEDPQPSGS